MTKNSVIFAAIGLAALAQSLPGVAAPRALPQAGPAPGETVSESYRGSQRDNVEYQRVPPIKIFDNLYYVGPGFVSVWLIPTSSGLILIDSAQEPYVDHVIASITKAGFDPKNIKYILLSHGHLDHFGGAARIQALSGARVAALEEDWQMIEAAYKTPDNPNRSRGPVLARDMVIKEGDTVTLGSTSLKVYKLPGHTPGSASFAFTVNDGPRSHKAFIFGGPGQRNGVEGGTQFLASLNRLMREQQDVEVAAHVHSWLTTYPYPGGGIFERAQKLAQRKPGDPHPFVDNATWRAWLGVAQAGTLKYIETERAKASAPSAQVPRADLAPTGTLRAAFLQTNPVQGRVDPQTGAVTGPVADLVRELARQKGVPFTILPVANAAAVIDHVNTHKADIGFLAYEAARATQVDFSQPYLLMGSAYLVRADSALKTSADVDRAGVKVATVTGQSQQIWVSGNVKRAAVQLLSTMPPDELVAKMIAGGEIDAFAANRDRMEPIARKSPAVRVLADNFMVVGQALVVEKGQASRLEALNKFVAEVRASGLVKSAIERAGLSGVEVAK